MLDLIKSRKSVRKYSEKHISDEDLRKILEAGRLAPSWMNVQSWKFILIKSEENKELLSKLFSRAGSCQKRRCSYRLCRRC